MQVERAMTAAERPSVPFRRIQPSSGLVPVDFPELWRYRELLYFFVWRDIKARYKQTFFGPAWALLKPLVMIVIFSAVFGGLAKIDSGSGEPYALFVSSGLIAWTYFSSAMGASVGSMLNNAGLVSKTYFPRLYAPTAAAASPVVDVGFALVVMFGLFAWYGEAPSWRIVFLPAFLVLALLASVGVGLWLTGASVRYRDIPFALPFATQIWMYLTPVIYPVTLVPQKYQWLLMLNPMTAVVEGFRWSLLGTAAPGGGTVAVSCGVALALLVSGVYYFRRTERTLADLM